jgi:hypothetical protein
MQTFMVERYLPGMECVALREAVRRAAAVAAAMTDEGVPVRYLGSTFVPDEEACFCRFEGRDAEAVREANERAGLPFWRVVGAVFVEQ